MAVTYPTVSGAQAPVHPSVTVQRVIDDVERHNHSLDDPGICLACGEGTEGVEQDARHYTCDACGIDAVFGVEEILIGMWYHE